MLNTKIFGYFTKNITNTNLTNQAELLKGSNLKKDWFYLSGKTELKVEAKTIAIIFQKEVFSNNF